MPDCLPNHQSTQQGSALRKWQAVPPRKWQAAPLRSSAPPSTRDGSPPVKLAKGSYAYICTTQEAALFVTAAAAVPPANASMMMAPAWTSSRHGLSVPQQGTATERTMSCTTYCSGFDSFTATHRCPVLQRCTPVCRRAFVGADAAVQVPVGLKWIESGVQWRERGGYGAQATCKCMGHCLSCSPDTFVAYFILLCLTSGSRAWQPRRSQRRS